ncbi:MAG: hypothetical protein H7175_13365 [Burkholderiales bacterium]|nr:hypothetical protein [Anaerolineae bacterium]
MRLRLTFCALLALVLAACQGPPPTQIILVVTATPPPAATNLPETDADTGVIQIDVTDELVAGGSATGEITPVATRRTSVTPAMTPTFTRPTFSPTPDLMPTATMSQILVAEQVFEKGRMFWLQPTDQIWVMIVDGEGEGRWSIFNDTFEDGELESDPEMISPEEGLLQPERGFGKLWRMNEEVQDALGWGITPEFGYVSQYEFHPGGRVSGREYISGPGYHILFSLYGEKFRFNESDNTWQLGD